MASSFAELVALPPDVLANTPAGAPPPGVVPNFKNPPSIVPLVSGINFTFGAISFLFLTLRVYMNIFILRRWKLADTCIVLSFLFAVVFCVAGEIGMFRGAAGKHTWDVHLDLLLYDGWYFSFWVTNTFSLLPVGLAKIAILLQCFYIFSAKSWMRIAIYIGLVAMIIFYGGGTVCMGILGSPWPGETEVSSGGTQHVLDLAMVIPPFGVISCLFDWYVLLLPIPAILRLQLSTGKKIGIIAIFATGLLCCISSIISAYYRYQVDLADLGFSLTYVFMWVQLEMWTAIIAACAPAVHQFWNRHAKLVWLSNLFKSSISNIIGSARGSSRGGSGFGDRGTGNSKGSSRRDNNNEKNQNAEDRQRMVKIPSMEEVEVLGTDEEIIELTDSRGVAGRSVYVERSFRVSRSSADQGECLDIEAQVKRPWPVHAH